MTDTSTTSSGFTDLVLIGKPVTTNHPGASTRIEVITINGDAFEEGEK